MFVYCILLFMLVGCVCVCFFLFAVVHVVQLGRQVVVKTASPCDVRYSLPWRLASWTRFPLHVLICSINKSYFKLWKLKAG